MANWFESDIRYSVFDITAVRLTVRERLVCIINHQKYVMYIAEQYAFGVLPVPYLVLGSD